MRIYKYTYVYSIYVNIYILNVIEFIWNSCFEVAWFGASVKTPRQRFGKRESSEDGVDVGFDGHGQILRDATQGVKACPGPFDTFNGLVRGKAGKATGNHGFDSWPSNIGVFSKFSLQPIEWFNWLKFKIWSCDENRFLPGNCIYTEIFIRLLQANAITK